MSDVSRDGLTGASAAKAPKAPKTPQRAEGAADVHTATSCLVEGEVLEVLDGYGLAHVLAPDGSLYGLTRETPGVSFADLHEGQRVRVEVVPKFNRVLRAQALE